MVKSKFNGVVYVVHEEFESGKFWKLFYVDPTTIININTNLLLFVSKELIILETANDADDANDVIENNSILKRR